MHVNFKSVVAILGRTSTSPHFLFARTRPRCFCLSKQAHRTSSLPDSVFIKNLRSHGHHGVHTEEQIRGQKFECDMRLTFDITKATESDDIEDTINYEAVCADALELLSAKPHDICRCNLIEKLANDIAMRILNKFTILQEIEVTVRKPHVPMSHMVDYTSVTITRNRLNIL